MLINNFHFHIIKFIGKRSSHCLLLVLYLMQSSSIKGNSWPKGEGDLPPQFYSIHSKLSGSKISMGTDLANIKIPEVRRSIRWIAVRKEAK